MRQQTERRLKALRIIVMIFIYAGLLPSIAEAETITLTASSYLVRKGESVTITAKPSNPPGGNGLVISNRTIEIDSKAIKSAPYQVTIPLGNGPQGIFTYQAAAIINGEPVTSNKISIEVQNPLTGIKSIEFLGSNSLVLFSGRGNLYLSPIARMNDGGIKHLSPKISDYSVFGSDGSLSTGLSIADGSSVSAKRSGIYRVDLNYQGLSASVNINVTDAPAEFPADSSSTGSGSSPSSGSSSSSSSPSQSGGGAVSPMAAIGLLLAIGALALFRRQDKKAVLQR